MYSANSWLAYKIAQLYYGGEHYVWCTPCFSSNSVPASDYTVPPSSSPSEIYNELLEDTIRGDRHSLKITVNKAGILRGAHCKEKQQVITKSEKAEIFAAVDRAETADFRPLIYVIPFTKVAKSLELVPVTERAHPLSIEYLIKRLPRKYFDVIEFRKR